MEMDQKCPERHIVIFSLSVCQFTTKSKHLENRGAFMITVCISNKLLYEQMGNIVFQGLKEIALTPNFCSLWWISWWFIYDLALDNKQISLKGECLWDMKTSYILMT